MPLFSIPVHNITICRIMNKWEKWCCLLMYLCVVKVENTNLLFTKKLPPQIITDNVSPARGFCFDLRNQIFDMRFLKVEVIPK